MSKKIYYEDRDGITNAVAETVQAKLKGFGTRLNEDDEARLRDFMEDLLEPFTEGDWKNYN